MGTSIGKGKVRQAKAYELGGTDVLDGVADYPWPSCVVDKLEGAVLRVENQQPWKDNPPVCFLEPAGAVQVEHSVIWDKSFLATNGRIYF